MFKILSLLIMVFFYGIYFMKMYFQKKKGIETRQIGKCKAKDIRIVEILMTIATFLIILIELISIFLDYNILTNNIRYIGILIGIMGDIIFLIAVITMKDSWRAGIPNKDKTELILKGIYQISRNPAFVGFDLMYLGICLIYFNILTVIFTLFTIIMLHLQILNEEKFLENSFGKKYLNYKAKVCRYLGRKGEIDK